MDIIKNHNRFKLTNEVIGLLNNKFDFNQKVMYLLSQGLIDNFEYYLYGDGVLGDVEVSEILSELSHDDLTLLMKTLIEENIQEDNQSHRLWKDNNIRLFISHKHAMREKAKEIKVYLSRFHIDCFVAHDDIKVSRKWKDEILEGLRTMDALLAFVDEDFHSSDWTDQEVGYAIGRGVTIIPFRYSAELYGFLDDYQGITRDGKRKISEYCELIIETLMNSTLIRRKYVSSLMDFIVTSTTIETLNNELELLKTMNPLKEDLQYILDTLNNNHYLSSNKEMFDCLQGYLSNYELILTIDNSNEFGDLPF